MSNLPQIPVTNLKDRIAALEQQRNAASTQRSASASPQLPTAHGSNTGGAGVGGLRAKFEKKGGIPVPRGTFGLGAPPPPEARVTRNGELYGNRPGIPQPLRMLSAQHTGGSISGLSSRSGSSMGFHDGSNGNSHMNREEWRQSMSMSSEITDLDERPDYTPLASPTFGFGPTSPELSPGSTVYTPEGSPTTIPPPPAEIQFTGGSTIHAPRPGGPVGSRSTSFAAAVEMAKKVAEGPAGEKVMLQEGASPTPFVAGNTAAIRQNLERSASGDKSGDATTNGTTSPEPERITSPSQLPYLVLQSPGSTADGPTPTVSNFAVTESPVASTPAENTIDATTATSLEAPSTVPTVQVTPTHSQSPPPEEPKRIIPRNNKDLSLNVEALKSEPKHIVKKDDTTPTEETTPTTSTYLNVLSPPSTSLSTGSSVGTPESMISPRPYSMVEFSLAERVTPATSRGNVMFIAPSTATLPRKSDMAFYPPTPTKDEFKPEEKKEEVKGGQNAKPAFAAVVHQKVREAEVQLPSSTSSSSTSSSTKVTVTTRSRSGSAPQTPKRNKHLTLLPLNSPAQPELFSLLQNAVMLESTLEGGELPEEANARKERERKEAERRKEAEILASALRADKAKAKAEEEKLLAFQEKEQEKEQEESEASRKAKLRHTFLIPLSKAKSVHGSSAEEEAKQSKELPELPDNELLPSPDANAPPGSAYPSLHSAALQSAAIPATPVVVPPLPPAPVSAAPPLPSAPLSAAPQPQVQIQNHPPVPPIPRDPPPSYEAKNNDRLRPKSAGVTKSRFSLRKLGSVKSVIGMGSSSSSKKGDVSGSDSMSISDAASFASSIGGDLDEFGGRPSTQYGHERESTWHGGVHLSPKKEKGMGRASTIGKMFSRSRNKSNGSVMSGVSDSSRAASIYALPPLPDTLGVISSSPEGEQSRDRTPRRSMSMKSLKGALKGRASVDKDRPTPASPPPPVPQIRTEAPPPVPASSTSPTSTLGSPLKSPDYIGYGSMDIPSDRPMSWMSVSSLESTLPSPLFEKDIFDAFPAVPASAAAPMTPSVTSVHNFRSTAGAGQMQSLEGGLQSAALMTPSFDSAFLGSAIHLAGSHKSTLVGTPTTAGGYGVGTPTTAGHGGSFGVPAPPTPRISAAPVGASGLGRRERSGSVHRS